MKLRREDLDYMRDTSAAVLEGIPITAHAILWSTFAFILVAFIWAYFAQLDEITRGEGKVIPSSNMQVIQNLEGGILKELFVKEGNVVQKDQILMIIDDTRFASSFRESEVKIDAIRARIAILEAETSGDLVNMPKDLKKEKPQLVQDEMNLYNTRKSELEIKLGIIEEQVKEKEQTLAETKRRLEQAEISHNLVAEELRLTRPLVQQGAVSEVELLRLERTLNDLAGEVATTKISIPKLESSIAAERQKREETILAYKVTAQKELNAAKSEFSGLSETNISLEDRVKRTLVRSPVHGTVNQINVKTLGGIIQAGEDLIEIVPLEDTLLISVEIKPSDIGFLRSGLEAVVKLTAYDFSIYGGLKGYVEKISADTVINDQKESVYQVTVRTEKNHLEKDNKKLRIIPGMRASVDILTGKKSVLDYLLKPILKTKEVALTER